MSLRKTELVVGSEGSESRESIDGSRARGVTIIQHAQRPGKGTIGSRCLLKVNHFLAELSTSSLSKYDVSVTPKVVSRATSSAVMMELIQKYKESQLGNLLPVYDGRCLYTAGHLPFEFKEFIVILTDEHKGIRSEKIQREYRIQIQLSSRIDLRDLGTYLKGDSLAGELQEAVHVLDIVTRQMANLKYFPLGRSFYPSDRRRSLGEGSELWRGFHQVIRPTQRGLSLNVDISATAFIQPLPVLNFVEELLDRNIVGTLLSSAECRKISTVLKGVKVKTMHHRHRELVYHISGLTSQPTIDLTLVRGSMESVVQYFRDTYQVFIQNTQWPCLQAGKPKRPVYLPIELCHIVEGQRNINKLTQKQVTSLLKATCQHPIDKQAEIVEIVNSNTYQENPYAKEFGIHISNELATVEARILPTPRLKYHETGEQKECLPRAGNWNMTKKKFVNAGRIQNWICINLAGNVPEASVEAFYNELASVCLEHGLEFNLTPVLPHLSASPEQVERVVKDQYFEAKRKIKGNELDLLIVILPDEKGSFYGDVKRICETDIGIISQCCRAKNVLKLNHLFLESLALKLNVKIGGRNTVLVDAIEKQIPLISEVPTIIFGAVVTPCSSQKCSGVSVSAVVASQDWPEITTYAALVSMQPNRHVIEDLFSTRGNVSGGMIREHLISFKEKTGFKPSRIIFYRHGVSRGKSSEVLIHEVNAIRKACKSLQDDYQPRITFIVVQKGHHTRLFPYDQNDPNSADRIGNVLPGTVVDSNICHSREFDFYLNSHAGRRGTNTPAHYHVLWDENNFSADALQSLTYNMCYTYAPCTSSVSVVPPVYYAHLAAARAPFYCEPTDAGAENSGTDTSVRPLKAVKDSIKGGMFYC